MALIYPQVCEEYRLVVEGFHRNLRGFIQEKHYAPLVLRLAWHSAGTYDTNSKTGGPFGTIRNKDELSHSMNVGWRSARWSRT
jgi:L-ascorbate peroxidase